MTENTIEPLCLTREKAAELLGIDEESVPRVISPFILPGSRIVRYRVSDIRERWNDLRPDIDFSWALKPYMVTRITKKDKPPSRKKMEPSWYSKKGNYKIPVFPFTGFVYFIGDGSKIKIGYAEKPKMRLATLQTNSPSKLHLVATMKGSLALEDHFHERFRQHNSHREWFFAHPDLIRCIKQVASWKYPELSLYETRTVRMGDV